MMVTCRVLCYAGGPSHVSLGPIIKKVHSFCLFILRDLERRAPSLKHLELSSFRESATNVNNIKTVYSLLSRVIRHAKNITSLDIIDVEDLLVHDPTESSLSLSLASLEKLQEVRWQKAAESTQKTFASMKAPIETADILFDCDTYEVPEPDLALFFRHAYSTLRSLRLTAHEVEFNFYTPRPFTQLQELFLESIGPEGGLSSLMKAFPNVTDFTWRDHREDGRFFTRSVEADLETMRLEELHRTADCWPLLDSLDAAVTSCYVAGIQMRVRRWSLSSLRLNNASQFYELVNVLQPSCLCVRHMSADVFDELDALELFPATQVKDLRVELSFFRGKRPIGEVMVRSFSPCVVIAGSFSCST